eukprot:10061141-Karenia_brevis.AAC.1
MIARFYCEFQARHPTMWSMTRTRSLAAAQRQDSSKRHKLTESVEISLVGGDPEIAMSIHKIRQYLDTLQVTANSWALAG